MRYICGVAMRFLLFPRDVIVTLWRLVLPDVGYPMPKLKARLLTLKFVFYFVYMPTCTKNRFFEPRLFGHGIDVSAYSLALIFTSKCIF